jgi:release factor glutamine methyltransferase
MSDEWTVRRIIDWTTAHLKKHGSDTPRLETEILLAHARGCRRIELYTRFDEVLSEKER